MRRTILLGLLPLVLVLAGGCSDVDPATGPAEARAEFELIPAAEIAAADFISDLSEEARAALREALQTARAEIRTIIERYRSGEISREDARALVHAVHVRLIETLAQFLTEEQIERVLGHGPGDDRPDLDLTAEQLRLIRALREECREAVAQVRGSVESGEITVEEGRRRIRRIAYECRQGFCAILQPDQQAKVPFCRGPEDGRPHD